jgi:hypothetical protein
VVICQLALSLVTNDIFLELFNVVYPTIEELIPSSVNTIRGWIKDRFLKRKEKLKASLRRVKSRIHFSFDLWTSPNHLVLLGIIGHYIDEHSQNQPVSQIRLFSLHPIPSAPGPHLTTRCASTIKFFMWKQL